MKTLRRFVLKVFSSSAPEAAALRLSSVEQQKGAYFSFTFSLFFSFFVSK